jgi:cytochrome b pre-mRNA-processing protein 3
MFGIFKKKDKFGPLAVILYDKMLARTRMPIFYERYGVPDTIFGRFDLLCIHAFLVIDRLYEEGHDGRRAAQSFFDHMFRETDRNLRELGVGDLGVPKQIKRLMKGFKGRALAYREAMESDNPDDLSEVLHRNLYGMGDDRAEPEHVIQIASYMHECAFALGTTEAEDIFKGDIVLPMIPENPEDSDQDEKVQPGKATEPGMVA